MSRWMPFTIFVAVTMVLSAFTFTTAPGAQATGPGAQATGPGVALSWGFNQQGQLGDGTNTDRNLPIKVNAGATVIQIAAATAGNHSLALLSDGTVMAWGENQVGNLGLGTGQIGGSRSTPGFVADTTGVVGSKLTGVVAVAAGGGHSLALKGDGSVYAWGDNSTAQLGTSSPGSPNPVPTRVGFALLGESIKAIVGGAGFSLALTQDGRVYCWGLNNFGACGNGTSGDGNFTVVPTPVVSESGTGVLADVTALGAGGQHSIAIKTDGSLRTWGYNQYGQLGDGFTPQHTCCALSTKPVTLPSLAGLKFTKVAGGDTHTLALQDDGTVWAWGLNTSSQLGRAFSGGPNPTPEHVNTALVAGIVDVAAGGSQTSMALRNDGTVLMWGSNNAGQLGQGVTDTAAHGDPAPVANLKGVQAIAKGNNHVLALASGYTLTVSTLGVTIGSNSPGTGTAAPASAVYAVGSSPSITATPDAGSTFIGWTLDGADAGWAVPRSITMDGPHTLVANFVKTPTFSDVPVKASLPKSDPAYPTTYAAITQLAARGVIRGYGDGTYGPTDKIFRSQQAALIGRPLYSGETASNPFSDKCLPNDPANCVDPELWNFVAVLSAHGIALGYNDAATCSPQPAPCYDPRAEVTYAQGISFITRTMVDKHYWVKQPIDPNLYGGALNGTGHEQDFATYAHYAGAPPDFPVSGPFTRAQLTAAGTRGWFAKALWRALDSYFGPAPAP
jgi:alpha-tubulin suppressor-like RCC1 family protein